MNEHEMKKVVCRREFLERGAAAGIAAALGPRALVGAGVEKKREAKRIGIQVGAVSFVDEGVESVLDNFEKLGAVNTIYLTTFTYGRGLSGRQIPGHPFPDHGVREPDTAFFHGGNYATVHPEFYKETSIRDIRAPDHGDLDIVALVLPAAKRRGMKVFSSVEDQWRRDVPGIDRVQEVDLYGRKARTLCLLNPDVRAFWRALVTDLCSSYAIDGILFFNERNGPLLNALGASHFQSIASDRVTCFCDYHRKAARERGIDFDRVREAYRALDGFVKSALADKRPSDGYFVEFWRLIVRYPEILLWDRLFVEAKHQVLSEVRDAVKAVRPGLEVGFHIEHVNSFNPVFRASRSYEDIARRADFLKVVAYNNCGGERYARFIRNVCSTVFRDVPEELFLRFNNQLLGYAETSSYEELPQAGLSPDYIRRETLRALAGVKGGARIYPGIDIGIPTGKGSRKASPEDTYRAVKAALGAGAHGVIYSRKYSEMRLANLEAAGRAAREFLG